MAKQVWRLFTNPNLLVSRVIQGRYAHNDSILNAPIKAKCSFFWRIFVWARELLQKGLRKRIGDGKSTYFFQDPWIPKEITFKPIPIPGVVAQEEVLVSDFITPTMGWNINRLQEVVCQEDVQCIMTIPISALQDSDKWIWHYCSNGLYYIKSGYKLALYLYENQDSANTNEHQKWWTTLWKTKVPQKVRMFIWKVYHGCLPTTYCLWKRNVVVSPICIVWRSKLERIDHALWGCKRSKRICDYMFHRVDFKIPILDNFADRIYWLAKHLKDEDFERACITFWSIWNDRNSLNNNMDIMDVEKRCEWIYEYWDKTRTKTCVRELPIHGCKERDEIGALIGMNRAIHGDGYKLFTDAAVGEQMAGAGYGVFIADAGDNVQGVMEFFDCTPSTPLVAEVNAIIHGIRLLQRMNISIAYVYSD